MFIYFLSAPNHINNFGAHPRRCRARAGRRELVPGRGWDNDMHLRRDCSLDAPRMLHFFSVVMSTTTGRDAVGKVGGYIHSWLISRNNDDPLCGHVTITRWCFVIEINTFFRTRTRKPGNVLVWIWEGRGEDMDRFFRVLFAGGGLL